MIRVVNENKLNDILHYGNVLTNNDFDNISYVKNHDKNCSGYYIDKVRVRIIEYNNNIYYHLMSNGEVLYCYQLTNN